MESQIHSNLSWDCVCIIGLGGHAKNKLLPGLKAAGLQLAGIVSRNMAQRDVEIFLTIEDAILYLPENTLFVVSTPPNVHYAQVKAVIEAGRDVFVEKPAFLSLDEALELSRLADERGVVLVEMLMYLENNSVRKIIRELKYASGSIKSIECQFTIPSIPPGTFRTEASLGNSLLSDIACYPLSLLAEAGHDLSNLVLDENTFVARQNQIFNIKGMSQKINIKIRVGLDSLYRNQVKLEYDNGQQVSCDPFFYGREGYRNFKTTTSIGMFSEKIYEINAYEDMFRRKRIEWLANQKSRFNALCLVSDSLEKLGRQAGMI